MQKHLIHYVKNARTGRIEATLAVNEAGSIGVAITNPVDRNMDKVAARNLAISRADNGEQVIFDSARVFEAAFYRGKVGHPRSYAYVSLTNEIEAVKEKLTNRAKRFFKTEVPQELSVWQKLRIWRGQGKLV